MAFTDHKRENIAKDADYFPSLINAQSQEIPSGKPVVIFLDGVSVTRNKEDYDLFDWKYGTSMITATMGLFEDVPFMFFQISDEISIITRDIKALAEKLNAHYITHDELCSLIGQAFSTGFSKQYGKQTWFHVRMHTVEPNDVERYIKWRQSYTKMAVYTYFAIRKGIWKGEYSNYEPKQLISVFMKQGVYGELRKNRRYIDGTIGSNAAFAGMPVIGRES